MCWQAQLNTGKKALFPATRKILGALRHLAGNTDYKTRLILANSLVMSRLHYLAPVRGGGTPAKYIREMQVLMNSLARYVTKLGKTTKSMTLMNRCSWLMADEFVEQQTSIQMWKLIYFCKPAVVYDKLEIEKQNSCYKQSKTSNC